jgi:hypothetical protein
MIIFVHSKLSSKLCSIILNENILIYLINKEFINFTEKISQNIHNQTKKIKNANITLNSTRNFPFSHKFKQSFILIQCC